MAERITVLVTVPEYDERPELLDAMRDVSARLEVVHKRCNTPEECSDALEGVEVLYTWQVPSHLARGERLRWVHTQATGIDRKEWSPIFAPEPGIIVTNAGGAHAVPIAEYCITVMVMLARGFLRLVADKATRTRDRSHSPPVELCGQTVGIAGYGGIGRELARMARAHRMRVVALKRNPERREATGYQWEGQGDPEGRLPERLFGPDELPLLLAESDFVVNCLPATGETRDLFGEEAFRRMKRSAYFINVGRGATVDEAALARALEEGTIAGAALDVVASEPAPLPAEHPFWELDNLFLSPHISGSRNMPLCLDRSTEQFRENLRRYVAGEPLLNRVSMGRGY